MRQIDWVDVVVGCVAAIAACSLLVLIWLWSAMPLHAQAQKSSYKIVTVGHFCVFLDADENVKFVIQRVKAETNRPDLYYGCEQ